ncbi:RNA polymerase sigma factor [Acetobacterium tundrae]|uniref:Sigma-70 family RNA polymerase sigma factor n=1 Tax=Acetobacterium tundrae TaxID=132932 RepID=A0ABR6WJ11_9FIRM|nr:RNA polymerase sigma factor [Acetobacterium tundrae]MBC3796487.1 sigma-70 family RNA polymerase sigma factor [Acetobacterium tundrae]
MSEHEKEQHFSELYEKYIDEIYHYVFLRTGLDKVTAEDIAQEIFIDVYKGLDRFKGLCSERTWIYRITKNKLSDYYRIQYKRSMEECSINEEIADQMTDFNQNIEIKMEETFQSQQVLECLRQLPDHYRMTLLLKYVDEKSVKDIAKIMEKSNKAVESILQRAKMAFLVQYQKIQEGEVSDEKK